VAIPELVVGQQQTEFSDEVLAALESLRALTPNWDGYGAPAIDHAVIAAAKTFIASLPVSAVFHPKVVPMSNGMLQLEWHVGPRSLELEFESPSWIRYLQWQPERGIEEEDSFPVTNVDTAVELIRWCAGGAGE
jgi:hypothetical protein